MPPTTTIKRITGELGVSMTTVSSVRDQREDLGRAAAGYPRDRELVAGGRAAAATPALTITHRRVTR